MDPDFAQRRRVFVAVAITAVAIPAAFLLNRNDDPADAAPQITLVGTVAPAGAAGQTALAAAGAASSSASARPAATSA